MKLLVQNIKTRKSCK